MRTLIAGSPSCTYEDMVEAIQASGFRKRISLMIFGNSNNVDAYAKAYAKKNRIKYQKFNLTCFGPSTKAARCHCNIEMAKVAEAAIIMFDGNEDPLDETHQQIAVANAKECEVYIYTLKKTWLIKGGVCKCRSK